jgi:hypothetical protein
VIMTTHQPALTQLATRTVHLRRGGILDNSPAPTKNHTEATPDRGTSHSRSGDCSRWAGRTRWPRRQASSLRELEHLISSLLTRVRVGTRSASRSWSHWPRWPSPSSADTRCR